MPVPEDVTISYASFAELWKRLVSKRKARKHGVDRDRVWAQLVAGKPIQFRGVQDEAEPREHRPREGDGDVDHKERETRGKAAFAVGIADLEPAPLPMKATRSPSVRRRAGKKRGGGGGGASTKLPARGRKATTTRSRKGRRTAAKGAGRR